MNTCVANLTHVGLCFLIQEGGATDLWMPDTCQNFIKLVYVHVYGQTSKKITKLVYVYVTTPGASDSTKKMNTFEAKPILPM